MLKLDKEKLKSRVVGSVSTEEALADVVPFDWPDEVWNGNKKVIGTKASTKDGLCVELEM